MKAELESQQPEPAPAPAANDNADPMAVPAQPPTSDLMAVSDERGKANVKAASSEPAAAMDSVGGGKSWNYKPGMPGEDPSKVNYGTTTEDLLKTDMGSAMVTIDPETGLEAIDIKKATSSLLAMVGNLNERLRAIEGTKPMVEPTPAEEQGTDTGS